MLYINTKVGQRILIPGVCKLLLSEITDDKNPLCEILFQGEHENREIVLAAGQSEQLTKNCFMTISKILHGKKRVASIGFEAPIDVEIYGEWIANRN
ncbi:MAG: hypothetical protein GY774_04745 [Planctomycetes bacterium]|nr:hypothetical protein [Planctomycetota bacterium]